MFLTHISPAITIIWHLFKDKNALWELWHPGKKLWNPSVSQDTGEPFWEDRPTARQLTHHLWSQLQKWQQLHTPGDLATAPSGFGSVTSTICQGTQEDSHPPVHQVIELETSIWAMDPEVAHEVAPAPLGHYCWFTKWPQYSESKKRPKTEADHSRLVGGRSNKQENYLQGLSLAVVRQVNLCPCLPESWIMQRP